MCCKKSFLCVIYSHQTDFLSVKLFRLEVKSKVTYHINLPSYDTQCTYNVQQGCHNNYLYAHTNYSRATVTYRKLSVYPWRWVYIPGRYFHSDHTPLSSPRVEWAVPAGLAAPQGLPSPGSG